MAKQNTKMIDDIVSEFFDHLESLKCKADIIKACNKLRRKIIKANIGLIHCLWNEHFIKETILKDLLEDDDFIASFFEDEMWNKKPKLVQRFKIIRQSFTKKPVAKRVQSQLIEATYCYLYGFDQAAIALCRATLEYAVKVRLNKRKDDRIGLEDLINKAIDKGCLSKADYGIAHNIRKYGNKVMHREPFQFDPMKIINDAREILESLHKPHQAEKC